MPMGDELASASLSIAQKSMEIGAELIRMLAPVVSKAYEKFRDEHGISGEVSRIQLFAESGKTKSAILSESNFLSQDAASIATKAKQYGIPVSIMGDGERATVSFLERDKAVVNQILQETMRERMKTAPQEVKQFSVSEHNVSAIKEAFAKNGVECCFSQSADGKIYCQYQAKDAEKAALIKQEFKEMRNYIAESLKVDQSKTGLGTITDLKSGKSVDLSQYGGSIKKYQAVKLLQQEFGYSKDKAILAAHKLCDDLHLDPKQFLARTEQIDNLKLMKTNIRFESDSILLKNISISAVHFADGEHTHLSIANGEKSAFLTPAVMNRDQMKKICVSELEMTPEQADETVEKCVKIDMQINSKDRETTIFRNSGEAQRVEINRTSNDSFSVKVGTTKRDYDFGDKNVTAKIAKDFGITEGKAQSIINKAQKQSAFMNNIEKTTRAAKDNAAKLTKGIRETIGKSKGAI